MLLARHRLAVVHQHSLKGKLLYRCLLSTSAILTIPVEETLKLLRTLRALNLPPELHLESSGQIEPRHRLTAGRLALVHLLMMVGAVNER